MIDIFFPGKVNISNVQNIVCVEFQCENKYIFIHEGIEIRNTFLCQDGYIVRIAFIEDIRKHNLYTSFAWLYLSKNEVNIFS